MTESLATELFELLAFRRKQVLIEQPDVAKPRLSRSDGALSRVL